MSACRMMEYVSEGQVLIRSEYNGNIIQRLICDIDKIPDRINLKEEKMKSTEKRQIYKAIRITPD